MVAVEGWAFTVQEEIAIRWAVGHSCVRPHLRTAQDVSSLHLKHTDVDVVCRELNTAWVVPSTYYWV